MQPPCSLWLLLLLASFAGGRQQWRWCVCAAPGGQRAEPATSQQRNAAAYCESPDLAPLYATIDADLQPWRDGGGISAALMTATLRSVPQQPLSNKAVGILFARGVPYIVTNASLIADRKSVV